jgi:hypothetical protein
MFAGFHRTSSTKNGRDRMKLKMLIGSACFALLAMPFAAQAQGIPGGAAHGYHEGDRIAGPVGAVVGTAVGGVIGGVEGVFGLDRRYYADNSVEPHYMYHHRRHHWHRRHHH